PIERLDPCWVRRRSRLRQQRRQPTTALALMAVDLPELPERAGNPQRRLSLASLQRPVQRGADVIVLVLKLLQPSLLLAPRQLRLGGLGKAQIVGQMP